MPRSKAEMAQVADRRKQLVALRRRGVQYDDPRVADLGYSSTAAARKDLIRALEQARDEQAAEVSVYRQEENERLDALLEAVWPEAQAGELRAVETVLKLMDRRAKLNGLDMPAKNEVSGPDGGAIPLGNTLAELTTLISTAGDPSETGVTIAEETDDDSHG